MLDSAITASTPKTPMKPMAATEAIPPTAPTALKYGLLSCALCGLLSRPALVDPPAQDDEPQPVKQVDASTQSDRLNQCSRCGGALHSRIPFSVARTWAFLIAALILYVPANLLPIMETRSFLGEQEDTILSGVVFLWISGSQGLAILVFVASIVIPLFKLMSLLFLVSSVQSKSAWQIKERSRLYRLVDAIGRWSMLDVYVVTLLVAVVQINSLAHIRAGTGAAAFGAVVVLTMLAARSFDPRLLWDALPNDHD